MWVRPGPTHRHDRPHPFDPRRLRLLRPLRLHLRLLTRLLMRLHLHLLMRLRLHLHLHLRHTQNRRKSLSRKGACRRKSIG